MPHLCPFIVLLAWTETVVSLVACISCDGCWACGGPGRPIHIVRRVRMGEGDIRKAGVPTAKMRNELRGIKNEHPERKDVAFKTLLACVRSLQHYLPTPGPVYSWF
jgi:hypothetical protein